VAKIKIIIGAIIGAVLFVLGIFVSRTGRHKQSGTVSDISDAGRLAERERELDQRLHGIDNDISTELDDTRKEADGLATKSKAHGNRKPSTFRSFAEIRKRNGLD